MCVCVQVAEVLAAESRVREGLQSELLAARHMAETALGRAQSSEEDQRLHTLHAMKVRSTHTHTHTHRTPCVGVIPGSVCALPATRISRHGWEFCYHVLCGMLCLLSQAGRLQDQLSDELQRVKEENLNLKASVCVCVCVCVCGYVHGARAAFCSWLAVLCLLCPVATPCQVGVGWRVCTYAQIIVREAEKQLVSLRSDIDTLRVQRGGTHATGMPPTNHYLQGPVGWRALSLARNMHADAQGIARLRRIDLVSY